MKDTSKQTTFVINTMSEATYKKNASSGKINENELNIVDDNDTNRMVVASYDMLKNLESSAAAKISAAAIISYDADEKKLELKNANGDVISQIDASAFIKDGMLNSISYGDDGSLSFVVKYEDETLTSVPVHLVDQALSGSSSKAVSNTAVKLSVDAIVTSVDSIATKVGDLQTSLLGFETKLNVLNEQYSSFDELTSTTPASAKAENDTVKVVNSDVAIYYTVTIDADGNKTWTEVKREQAAYVRSDEVDIATADLKPVFSSKRLLAASSSYEELSSRLSSNVRVPSSKLLAEALSSIEAKVSDVDAAKTDKSDFDALSTSVKDVSSDYLKQADKMTLSSSLSIDVVKNDEADDGSFATYEIKQGGKKVGTSISIPRDFLVKSGELKTCAEDNVPAGFKAGEKYIDFIINAKAGKDEESHMYINVNDLVDVYTGMSSDSVAISIEDNKVSATVNAKGIVKDMLAEDVSTFISSQYDDAVKYVDKKIASLSIDDIAGSVGKTVSKVTEASGTISVEFSDISITQAQVQDLDDTFDLYYKKTETSSNVQLADKFNSLSIEELVAPASMTATKIVEKDGIISVEFNDISIAQSQVDKLADTFALYYKATETSSAAELSDKFNSLSIDDLTSLASKTATKISEKNGVISVEFNDISIAQSQVADLANTFSQYWKKAETSSATELSGKFDTLSTYSQISAQLTNDGYALSADVDANDKALSNAINSKIKIGTYKDNAYAMDLGNLSIVQIDGDDYYKLVKAAAVNPEVVYVVSGDVLNAYDRRVTNVEDPEDEHDAVNKQYASSMIDNALSAYYKKEDVQKISSDIVDVDKVTISCESTAAEGYASTYKLYQNGVQVGCDINIPKDFLVRSGKIASCIEAGKPVADLQIGDKYLDFIVNAKDSSSTDEHIYIKVQDLVDVYTGTSTSSIKTEIGDDNTISATIIDKSVTKAMLSDDVTSFIADQCVSAKNYVDDEVKGLSIANALSCKADETVDELTESSGIISATFKKISIAQSQVQGLDTKFNDYYTSSQTSSAIQLTDKFNSLSSAELEGARGKTVTKVVEKEGIISAQYEDIWISTSQVDGLSDYYLKIETSSATDIANEFSKLSTYAQVKNALSGDGYALSSDISAHIISKSNPHEVKADQLSVYLSSQTSSDMQLSIAFKEQNDALESIVSSLWQNLSGYAYVDKDAEELKLKTATQMTPRDLADSILKVATFLSSIWAVMQKRH